VPARAFICGNSMDSTRFKIDDAHTVILQPACGRLSSSSK
jgi:hypothetical protein